MGEDLLVNGNMRTTIITANLGSFDRMVDPVPQTANCDFHRYTDSNMDSRSCVMTTKLQARIPKMFGWQLAPGYDCYIWIDSSFTFSQPDSVQWFLDKCGDADLAVLQHPARNTIQQESDFLKKRLEKGCPYITPRYKNEFLDEQLAVIKADPEYVDDLLVATTVMVYKNTPKVQAMMKEWWYHTSRYHNDEQLSFPYVLKKSGCSYNIIPDKYMGIPYITYLRKKGESNGVKD